jgi:hypothetical protein
MNSRNSSWPIVLAIVAVVAAAFWYDAKVASAGASSPKHAHAAGVP